MMQAQSDEMDKKTTMNLSEKSGFTEPTFIIFIAVVTSIVAFSVDMMLPALLDIGAEYSVQDPNDVQLVIAVFLLSFGASQLLFGPLSDSFGRRNMLVISLAAFSLSSIAALFAPTFEMVLVARIAAGISAGAARSASQAVVRDCFVGKDMARVMSLVMASFMIAPIIAPPIGQLIIYLSNWHWVFLFLGIGGAIPALWSGLSMKETLPPEQRRAFSLKDIFDAFKESLNYRRSTGYMIVSLACTSMLFAFIVSSAQVFSELYEMGDNFIFVFTIGALALAASSLLNGHWVKTIALRRIMHISQFALLLICAVFFALALYGPVPLPVMVLVIMATMSLFGLINANAISVALEPMGHIAGTASSVINTIAVTGGTILGGLVGQFYNDSVIPMAVGYLLFAIAGLLGTYWGERGKFTLR